MQPRVFIALVALLLAGCMPHGTMDHPQVTTEEIFIVEMIPHHAEAVESAILVRESENPEVRALANEIIAAQDREIAMMEGWLAAWYPAGTYRATYEKMMPDLSALDGDARDTAFLEGMIAHHEMAIEMAEQALALTLQPEVRALAEAIVATQTAEIHEMEDLLGKALDHDDT